AVGGLNRSRRARRQAADPPRIGSAPPGTLRSVSTSPDWSITATSERLRCMSIPTWTDTVALLSGLVCHSEAKLAGLSRKGGPASHPAPTVSVLISGLVLSSQ